jgi:hypothetical protein
MPFYMMVITCFIGAMIQFKIAGPPSLVKSSSSCIPERAKHVAKRAVQTAVLVCFLKGMIKDVCIAWAYSMKLLAEGQPFLTVMWRGANAYGLLVLTGPNADDFWKVFGLLSIYWDRLNFFALHEQKYVAHVKHDDLGKTVQTFILKHIENMGESRSWEDMEVIKNWDVRDRGGGLADVLGHQKTLGECMVFEGMEVVIQHANVRTHFETGLMLLEVKKTANTFCEICKDNGAIFTVYLLLVTLHAFAMMPLMIWYIIFGCVLYCWVFLPAGWLFGVMIRNVLAPLLQWSSQKDISAALPGYPQEQPMPNHQNGFPFRPFMKAEGGRIYDTLQAIGGKKRPKLMLFFERLMPSYISPRVLGDPPPSEEQWNSYREEISSVYSVGTTRNAFAVYLLYCIPTQALFGAMTMCAARFYNGEGYFESLRAACLERHAMTYFLSLKESAEHAATVDLKGANDAVLELIGYCL